MKCSEINTEIIRKDSDFYFLRDILQKLYPAIVVRYYHIIINNYFNNFNSEIIDATITTKIIF